MLQLLLGVWIIPDEFLIKTIHACLQTAQRLLQRFLEAAANGHHLTYRLHLSGQMGVSLRKFLEGEAGDFGDHIIDGRFEARRRRLGDVIAQLV